jgi:hypothetical protein
VSTVIGTLTTSRPSIVLGPSGSPPSTLWIVAIRCARAYSSLNPEEEVRDLEAGVSSRYMLAKS